MSTPVSINTKIHPEAQASARAKVYTLADLIAEVADEHLSADKAMAECRNLGPAVQFDRLRDELGGFWPVGMVGMHATPGAGKSAFGIQAAMHAECPAIIVTCEMSGKTVVRRMLANENNAYLGDYARGKIKGEAIRAAATALAAKHPHFGIIDAVTAPCPVDLLRSACAAMRKYGDHLFIVVDSLHAWGRGLNMKSPEHEVVTSAVAALRAISAEQNATILAVVERNRASMADGGLSAGAGSRTIEYSAEVILELEAVLENIPGKISTGVNVRFAKNRNGRAGVKIGFAFDGAFQRFDEVGPAWNAFGKSQRGTPRSSRLDEEPEDAE